MACANIYSYEDNLNFKMWTYAEPIFSSEDIQRQMASDAEKFSLVDNMWRSLMYFLDSWSLYCSQTYFYKSYFCRSGVTVEPRVLVTASRQGLLDERRSAFDILEDIQKGLHDYLEKKRLFFSRLLHIFIHINQFMILTKWTKKFYYIENKWTKIL